MTAAIAAMVSNRLRPPVLALLCLAAAQLLCLVVASCDGEAMPMGAVRVHVTH